MSEFLTEKIKTLIPKVIFEAMQPIYHLLLSVLAVLYYGFPSRKLKVLFITGTKGKSTTAEIVNSILESAGYTTALSSTIRSKIAGETLPNLQKMTTPGRFFLQHFLYKAKKMGCDWVIIEMTSQAVLQFRHKFIYPDALIFTGIHPEHIEAHGSFENYLNAKRELVLELERSPKRPRIAISNMDDPHGGKFLSTKLEMSLEYRLDDWQKYNYKSHLVGDFNKRNILAAATFARAIKIEENKISKSIEDIKQIPGRMEFVKNNLNADIVVDYAHTPGSLEAVYETLKKNSPSKMICVLGACGGGRDTWKRPEFGKIAELYCNKIILTDEDPYDENPLEIIRQIETGISDKSKLEVEPDRRLAIARALLFVEPGSVLIISGKGTDPYIMGPNGSKTPWSDKQIVGEELAKL